MISALKKSVFIKNVSTLSSGIVVAHLVTIVASLFLTRLYSPNEIGYLTFFNSLSIVLANIFTLGYELAIVTPKSKDVAINLVLGTFYLLIFFSGILFAIILILLIWGISPGIGIPSSWLVFLPAGILFLGCINIALEWFNRSKQYWLLSYIKVIQSVTTSLPQILIGYFYANNIGLVTGFITGRFVASVIYIKEFLNKIFKNYQYNFKKITQTLKSHDQYPKYVAPTLVLDRLSMEAPYFLLPFLFNESILGFFAISYRVLSVPLSFLGTAIGQVFFKFLATKKNTSSKLTPSLIKTWLYLSLIGIIPMGIILFGGAPLFEFIFGEGWGYSGTLAVLLVPMLYLDFISSPTGRSFLVLNLEHYTTIFSITRITYVVLSLYLGYIYESALIAILLLSLSRALALIIQNLILYLKAKKHDSELIID